MSDVADGLGADEIKRLLGLIPHPEGGHYVETFRDGTRADGRATSTAIYFLLAADECSAWHKVDAAEIWLWHAGAPLSLTISHDGSTAENVCLGADIRRGQRPQAVVPAEAWQMAQTLGPWTLVACVVAPGFRFEGFTLAAPDWTPGRGKPG